MYVYSSMDPDISTVYIHMYIHGAHKWRIQQNNSMMKSVQCQAARVNLATSSHCEWAIRLVGL